MLGVTLTPDMERAARALVESPYRVLLRSGHAVGKTYLGACLVNWFFDCYVPGVAVSTAPTEQQVKNLLWKEVRGLRERAGLPGRFIGPAACEMRTAPDHYAIGLVAGTGEAYQGKHDRHLFFLLEECVGIKPHIWTTIETMAKKTGRHFVLAICNPTDTTSYAHRAENTFLANGQAVWRALSMSSLDHPNIAAGLRGVPVDRLPVPNAVDVGQVDQWVASWCDPVDASDRAETDLEWRPGSGHWFRPGPEFECRVLGQWPSAGTYGVWSELLWKACERARLTWLATDLPEIGCDVARFGDDQTAVCARWGPCATDFEAHNGWDTVRTWNRLVQLADDLAGRVNAVRHRAHQPLTGKDIPIKVDDTGVGGGVTDALASLGYLAVPVNPGCSPTRPGYPNVRSELWFVVADRARHGLLDLHRLSPSIRQDLKNQAMAPVWKPDALRQRVVETKEETKKKLRASPDGMDALNLAFFEGLRYHPPGIVDEGPRAHGPDAEHARRVLFGRS